PAAGRTAADVGHRDADQADRLRVDAAAERAPRARVRVRLAGRRRRDPQAAGRRRLPLEGLAMGRLLGPALRAGLRPGRPVGRPLRAAELKIRVGTSGWSYPSWRPAFYPEGTKPEQFLTFYAERFDTVELNTTGYRLP